MNKLIPSRYGWPTVTTSAELLTAKVEQHRNVFLVCSCGHSAVVSIGAANSAFAKGICTHTAIGSGSTVRELTQRELDDEQIDSDCNEYRERNFDQED